LQEAVTLQLAKDKAEGYHTTRYVYNDIISKLVPMLSAKLLFTRSYIAGSRGHSRKLAENQL